MNDPSTLDQLYQLLDSAEKLAKQFTGGYSDHFFSAEEFHTALSDSIAKLKTGDMNQLDILWLWFAPSYDWDDFVQQDGENLANNIFPLLSELRNHRTV